jgi:hypothetical protein
MKQSFEPLTQQSLCVGGSPATEMGMNGKLTGLRGIHGLVFGVFKAIADPVFFALPGG